MEHLSSTARRGRIAGWLLPVLLVLGLGGCELDGSLDAAGRGTMTIRYRLMNAAQLETAKKRLQSDRVTVVRAEVTPDKWATFTIEFPEVGALSTTEFFQKARFTLTEDGSRRRFEAQYANPDYERLPDELAAYFGNTMSMTLRVPGRIVESNAPRVSDNAATWTYDIQTFSEQPRVAFTATYDLAGGGAAAAAATPAAALPNNTP